MGLTAAHARTRRVVVALTADPDAVELTVAACPLDAAAVRTLLDGRPELLLDGERPSATALAERVSGFWLPDEVIVYIGLAGTSISKRVGQYYRTPLGSRKPHAGGWFLKLLSNIDLLHVHFARCDDADAAESAMLGSFVSGVSEGTREILLDPGHPSLSRTSNGRGGRASSMAYAGQRPTTPRQVLSRYQVRSEG